MTELPISAEHGGFAELLTGVPREPFDRMLQAGSQA
jgi:hypothetical protein